MKKHIVIMVMTKIMIIMKGMRTRIRKSISSIEATVKIMLATMLVSIVLLVVNMHSNH